MEVLSLLAQARAAGLDVQTDGDQLVVQGPQWAAPLADQLGARKHEVMALLERDDTEIAWRVAAFRASLPARGPIWPPKLRISPQTDMPGCCSLCGDLLQSDPPQRLPRCRPCIEALWLALNDTREAASSFPPTADNRK